MNTLRGIFLAPGCRSKELQVCIDGPDGSLKALQALVGGLVDVVGVPGIGRNLDMWVNDEGLLMGLPENFHMHLPGGGNPIAGNVFFTASNDEGETVSLSDEEVAHLQREIIPNLLRVERERLGACIEWDFTEA